VAERLRKNLHEPLILHQLVSKSRCIFGCRTGTNGGQGHGERERAGSTLPRSRSRLLWLALAVGQQFKQTKGTRVLPQYSLYTGIAGSSGTKGRAGILGTRGPKFQPKFKGWNSYAASEPREMHRNSNLGYAYHCQDPPQHIRFASSSLVLVLLHRHSPCCARMFFSPSNSPNFLSPPRRPFCPRRAEQLEA